MLRTKLGSGYEFEKFLADRHHRNMFKRVQSARRTSPSKTHVISMDIRYSSNSPKLRKLTHGDISM